jgi:acyl-coenzyme A thioesterase PaaI-like protein
VLAALADVALGRILAISETPRLNLITMNLNIDYLSAAQLGQWVEASGRVDRVGKRVALSSGMITADGDPVARMAGSFMRFPR